MPPQNVDAEMAVLGAMLLGDRGAVEKATEILQRGDFYREAHAHIFESMVSLIEKDEPVDIVTLKDELGRRNLLDLVGGVGYLMTIHDFVPTAANTAYYADIVAEKALLRRLIEAGSKIAGMAYGEVDEVQHLVDEAEREILDVARTRNGSSFTPLRPLLSEAFEKIDLAYHDKGQVTGLDTGFTDLNFLTSGLQDGDLIIIAARPSMGKCLTATSLIDDPVSGERVTIEQYVRERRPLVNAVTPCGCVRPARVSHWIDSGVKACWRVTTRTGRSVEVTGHHPFLTIHGWTPLHDLKCGDRIGVPRTLPVFGCDDALPLSLVRLLAYFIAEGGLTGKTPHFTNTDPAIVADFHAIIREHFPECVVRQRRITYSVVRPSRSEWTSCPNRLTAWLRELGLWGKLASDKFLPECVWRWSRAHLVEFLRVLLSCDGTIYAMHGYPRIEFAVASEGLARDVHHALVRFGIVSKLWRKGERCWRVEITEPDSVDRYQGEIGWIGEKANRTFRSGNDTTQHRRRSNSGHLPRDVWTLVRDAASRRGLSLLEMAARAGARVGDRHSGGFNLHTSRGLPRLRLAAYAEVLDDDHLRMLAGEDLYWDEIVAIESIGEQQVYDLTVPAGANFIAQDICVHNTSLAIGIGQNVAIRTGKSVAIFSMEMSKDQLVQRMICSEARVDAHRMRTGNLRDEDWTKTAEAVQRLWDATIFIDDATDMGPMEMRAKCRRLKAEHDLDLVILDYLQLMRGSGKSNANRNEEITEISRGLKSIAREMQVPVIALAQLSRAVERREDKRPMLSDLRDSGSIEAEADIVGFIYRPAYYERKQDVSEEKDEAAYTPGEYEGEEAEVIIAKHRNGPTGVVKMSFLPKFARFDNLAQREF
jgi:replicative DNA helicase